MIGAHLNKRNGNFYSIIQDAIEIGTNVLQIFTISPQKFDFPLKHLKSDDTAKTKQLVQEHDIKLFIHSSYLLNFCDTKNNKRNAKVYAEDLQVADQLGAIGCVIHMGKKKSDQTPDEALDAYVENLKFVLDKYTGDSFMILETSAGQGNDIGVSIEKLAELYEKFAGYKRRIRFCIDTCHIFSAGYDISKEYFSKFDQLIGMDKVVLFHLNDSKVPLGAKKDRHENLQNGYIFKDVDKLQLVVDMSKKYNIPMVLETHDSYPYNSYKKEFELVRSLDSDKPKIINLLKELASIYDTLQDVRRRDSFMKAVSYLQQEDLIPDKKHDLMKIKGVGSSIADKIIEIRTTGKLKKLDELKQNKTNELELLMVKGIGPAQLQKLSKQNIHTLEDLKKSDVKLTKLQQLGLKYFEDLNSRIPREEITRFEIIFKNILKELNVKGEITGSYRRGAKDSHDIDTVISSDKNVLKEVVALLKEKVKFVADLTSGTKMYSGLFILNKQVRQIDILYTKPESYALALIHFTGPQEKNIIMRNKAKELGYKLSDKALINNKTKETVIINSEDELMKFLGL